MISAGFGCKKACAVEHILAALDAALAAAARTRSDVSALYAPDFKREELGLQEAAEALQAPLFYLSKEQLLAQEGRVLTHSAHALEHTGISCIAETCALAGAEQRAANLPARLLGPREKSTGATCALAITEAP